MCLRRQSLKEKTDKKGNNFLLKYLFKRILFSDDYIDSTQKIFPKDEKHININNEGSLFRIRCYKYRTNAAEGNFRVG